MRCPAICFALMVACTLAGCASAPPKVQYARDPKSGELFDYSSASDGRTWVERHPAAAVPIYTAQLAGVAVAAVAAGVGVFAVSYATGASPFQGALSGN